MKAHQTDFSRGSVYRNIMEVAAPMILAQLLNLLYNIVDRIYIGRIPEVGTTALTGVGICFPIISLVSALSYLYGNGGAPLCAMERGRGNEEEAEKLMGNSFFLLLVTGVVLLILGELFYRPVLYLFGASDATFVYAREYIRLYLLGTVFVMVSVGMNPFINSQGFGNMGMVSVLIGAALNILLDPLFIFGFQMGVKGAALATDSFPALLRSLGDVVPDIKKSCIEAENKLYAAGSGKGKEDFRAGCFRVYYVLYKQSGAGGM